MKLPLLISVPHAGTWIPPVVRKMVMLTEEQIMKDADGGAEEIYFPLKQRVRAFVSAKVARAVVDLNRSEDNRTKDGAIKTHTSWDVPIYSQYPSDQQIEELLKKYYRPYHRKLNSSPKGIILGVDCHTMAAEGPPVGPDPGTTRPHVCISNAEGTCPEQWMESLAKCLEETFETMVSINQPFKGGYIIRAHAAELPWVQLEISRESFLTNQEKSERTIKALENWCDGKKGMLREKNFEAPPPAS